MPSILTLTDAHPSSRKSLGSEKHEGTRCVCKTNTKTGRKTQLCFFEKGALLPSNKRTKKRGMKITGSCP